MSFVTPLSPWEHQHRARELSYGQQYFAYLMDMGTGKTKVIIDEFMEYYTLGWVDVVIIYAPKGVYDNWIDNELPTHIHEQYKGEVKIAQWQAGGGNKTNQRILEDLLSPFPGLRILVINTESMSSGDTAYNYVLRLEGSSKIGCYVAVDESTFIKSESASRTKKIAKLSHYAEVKFRRIATGSPVTRSPLDLYGQADFLKPGLLGQSFFAFRARFAVLQEKRFGANRRPVQLVVGYRNIDELAERLKKWSFRILKEECLDLPEKIYTKREVELTDEQHRLYNDMKEFALAELTGGGTVSSSSVITQILRLQQLVCGHVKDDNGELRKVDSNRISTLLEVCSEVSGKAIIWSRFRHDVDEIVAALQKEYGDGAVAQFHGGNTQTRGAEAERYIRDPNCRFMVATYAGGYGNTWVVANTVIYYSNDYALEKRAQSEDRAHRAGQRNAVTYVDLVARKTVDETILKALRDHIDMAATITGDNWREWVV